MIIVRLLSPEPVGWRYTTNSTRVWEPTLSWNQFHQLQAGTDVLTLACYQQSSLVEPFPGRRCRFQHAETSAHHLSSCDSLWSLGYFILMGSGHSWFATVAKWWR